MAATEVKVPNIGDFKNIPVIELLVKAGDAIKKDDPLLVLEADKGIVEVPAPVGGVVSELKVKIGDKVSVGSLLALVDGASNGANGTNGDAAAKAKAAPAAPAPAPAKPAVSVPGPAAPAPASAAQVAPAAA
ncbi:MAG TPA: biotin/lipoyl-containing protein, partial [Polyangia bacterium]